MHNRKLKEWKERQREKTNTVNCSRCEGQAKHFPWKIQIEQLLLLVVKRNGKYEFDNVQAARELIKNAPALREKLGIERVARYRHYLIAVFPNIFPISRLFFSPSKPLRYFPLIICHVSMQISIH